MPTTKNSKKTNPSFDWYLYKYRHLIENVFSRLKQFRSIATRFEKLQQNFEGMLAMACLYLWLPL
ncbi:MAG: transposase [Oligoflexales bacterium]